MTEIPIIQTERTVMTVLTPDQAHLIADYYSRNWNHLCKWEPRRDESFFTVDSWQQRLEHSYNEFQQGRGCSFAALDPTRTYMIAGCNFNNIVRGVFQACHLGFSIDENYQGKGIMYEVCSAGIEYMFSEQKLHRIMANHLPENKRSEKLLKHLGFQREGYAKAYLKINGHWQDHVLTALINNNYETEKEDI